MLARKGGSMNVRRRANTAPGYPTLLPWVKQNSSHLEGLKNDLKIFQIAPVEPLAS